MRSKPLSRLEREGKAENAAWERSEREAGYPATTVTAWRKVLHLILGDAVEDGNMSANPASRRRGRGRRRDRAQHRAPEKAVTTALGVLLIAERVALLSGRDDEFVAVVGMGFTGLRWGETVGLETQYVRPGAVRVEWQLYELDNGTLLRCPPKDDSYRTVAAPAFVTELLSGHVTRQRRCPARVMACATCSGVTARRVRRCVRTGRAWLTWPAGRVCRRGRRRRCSMAGTASRRRPSCGCRRQSLIWAMSAARSTARLRHTGAGRLRHVAVPTGGDRRISGEGATAATAGAAAGRSVAGGAGPGP
ncbi:hypothetical protein GCM10007977_088390 [Dactylosporangium sucinum]|uniref:Uncharacterized protein n=1 Tax=Dactylosporangium sucinum TaxID=1424081 RepID=A0A917X5U5_9ACTN|nr:hypothetical protein GCM10007977_088390 [Dactylosporangium sucinum]